MRALLGLLIALFALCAVPASAHLTENSEVTMSFADDAVLVEAAMPAGPLALAAGPARTADDAALARWLLDNVTAISADGRTWQATVSDISRETRDGAPLVVVTIHMIPPTGASARQMTFGWSAILADVPDHFAMLIVGADYGAGVLSYDRRLIGALRGASATIAIDRGAFSQWAAFGAAFRLGMSHIAEGADHLMFLLALMLPAPLLARGRRWAEGRAVRDTVLLLLRIITAFTIGHSLTLIIAAIGVWQLPVAPVELAIALSILVSAIHAIRPLFAGREMWMAGGFGLIHGLAFATLVGDAGLSGSARLLSILGFNLGIEAIQLLVVACALVPLAIIAGRPAYRPIRISLAIFAAVAAVGWLVERSTDSVLIISEAVDWIAAYPLHLWTGAIALALTARLVERAMRPAPPLPAV